MFSGALTAGTPVNSDENFALVVPLTGDAKILKIVLVLVLELVLDAENLALEQKVHYLAFGQSASQ
jgi:hypothetical protein